MRRSLHPHLRETEAREQAAIRAMDRMIQNATELRHLMMLNHHKKLVYSTQASLNAVMRFEEQQTLEQWLAAKRACQEVASSREPWVACDTAQAFIDSVR